MWPWGHAAVGYLLYTAWCRYRHRRAPTGPAALAVLFGTQLPDLVDKPLGWDVGLLPTGRSLAHSWLVAGVVLAALWWYVDDEHRAIVVALGVGWLSHGLADATLSIAGLELAELSFLVWPLLPVPFDDAGRELIPYILAMELTPYMWVQFGLAGVAFLAWLRDGRPGLATARSIPAVVSRSLG